MGSPPLPGRGTRVLVCEDEGLTVLRVRKALRSLGYDIVGEASNGEDAVLLAETLRPDLVLMDVNMPRMDGIEATGRIMRTSPTAVVMITAYSEQEQVRSALEAGASGYLVKPVRDEQLQPAISVALATFAQLRRVRESNTELRSLTVELAEAGRRERLLLEEAERQARDAMQRAQELRRDLQREREATAVLAESFLARSPEVPGAEIATGYHPATEPGLVGGDFLDFIPLEGQRLGVVIGDLCGHGLSAAPHLARAKYMLRAYALEDPSPAHVTSRLNHALLQHMEEECPFLTMVYGVLNLHDWTFTYCNAGHPAPLLWPTPSAEGEALESTGGLVGVIADMEYREETAVLAPGAALVLFTDGVIEARRAGEMFEHEGVRRALRERSPGGAGEMADTVLGAAREFAGGRLTDDVAITVVRRVTV